MEILHLLVCFVTESTPSNRIMRHAFTFVSTWQYMKTGLKLVKFHNSLSIYKTWSIPGIWMKEAFFKSFVSVTLHYWWICGWDFVSLLKNVLLGLCFLIYKVSSLNFVRSLPAPESEDLILPYTIHWCIQQSWYSLRMAPKYWPCL